MVEAEHAIDAADEVLAGPTDEMWFTSFDFSSLGLRFEDMFWSWQVVSVQQKFLCVRRHRWLGMELC
jgi:hypothetical protein